MGKNVNVYVAITKLGGKDGVMGRLDYISNPDRQEHLLATGGQMDTVFWQRLADECNVAWNGQGPSRKSGKKSQCVEAREIIVQLPNDCIGSLEAPNLVAAQKILDALIAFIEDLTGTKCGGGLHLNTMENNLHAHIIMAERLELANPEIQRASRNLWIDERGRQCKAKKDILDEAGNIKKGCKVIRKGTVTAERHFGEKLDYFADKGWLYELKKDIAGWINDNLDPDKKRTVFDRYSPYIAQKHIGKGERKNAPGLKQHNKFAKEFNDFVDNEAITLAEAYRYKGLYMLAPDQNREIMRIVVEITEQIKHRRGIEPDPVMSKLIATESKKDKRTRRNPENDSLEADKQELRQLYRNASVAWALYRENYWDLEKRIIYLRAARAASAKIDAKRREMGDYTSEDYFVLLRKQEEELSRRRKEEYWVTLQLRRAEAAGIGDSYTQTLETLIRMEKNQALPDYELIHSLQAQLNDIYNYRAELREEEKAKLKAQRREAKAERRAIKQENKKAKAEARAKAKEEKEKTSPVR